MQNVTIKMKTKKLYWKGIEQLNSESTIVEGLENNEFVEKLPVNSKEENDGASRRDFLKYVGFSSAAAALEAVKDLLLNLCHMLFSLNK